jgi:intermembrane space import and assembly protein 40
LKEGPCGGAFVHAFACFIRSEHEDQGMDCLDEFKAFQVNNAARH